MKKKNLRNLLIPFMCLSVCLTTQLVSCGNKDSGDTDTTLSDIHLSGLTSGYVGDSITLTSDVTGVTWSSSDTSLATVNDGVVSLLKKGSVKISASKDGYNTATYNITINEKALESITITGSTSVNVGSTITLTSNVTDVNWSSSDTKIATVSSIGVVTGVAEGSTTITASKDGYNTGSYTIKVTKASETGVTTITYTPSGATNLTANIASGGTYIKTAGISDTINGVTFNYSGDGIFGVAKYDYTTFNIFQIKAGSSNALTTSEITLKSFTCDYYSSYDVASEINLVLKIGTTLLDEENSSEGTKTGVTTTMSGKTYDIYKYTFTYTIPDNATGVLSFNGGKHACYFGNINMSFVSK